MRRQDTKAVYQACDLLKLAMGEGMVRTDEPLRLMAAVVSAVRHKQPDIAGFIMDAFRPLIREVSPEKLVTTSEQLLLISMIALRHKQNFLAAKAVDFLCVLLERPEMEMEPRLLAAGLGALRTIGTLGIRRKDQALFREIITRVGDWARAKSLPAAGEPLVIMMTEWIFRSIQLQDMASFALAKELILKLVEWKVMREQALDKLLDEMGEAAGTACLNPHDKLAGAIMEMLLLIATEQQSAATWNKVIAVCGRISGLAVGRYGIEGSFPVYRVLMEIGRKMLVFELKFVQSTNESRRQVLFGIAKECVMLAALAARQDITSTPGEIIVSFYNCWCKELQDSGKTKSVKKFCQLLLFLWLKSKRQGKKYFPGDAELMQPVLFSEEERRRLQI
jgi:hypothetical protein